MIIGQFHPVLVSLSITAACLLYLTYGVMGQEFETSGCISN